MITDRWGKPSEVPPDHVVAANGTVRGVANPDRPDVATSRGQFDARTVAVTPEGTHVALDGTPHPFRISGRLAGRTL